MLRHRRSWLLTVAGVVLFSAYAFGQSAADSARIDDIRAELRQLPSYGVFDFMTFNYDRGTVVLSGYVYQLGLKQDAERAVKRVAGVDTVKNAIEVLPASSLDDKLRWATFYRLYRNTFLSQYAIANGFVFGIEPVGDYAMHIIVQHGRIQLLGVVNNQNDKNVAGIVARGVPGAFGVENDLTVKGQVSPSASAAPHSSQIG